jgi:uncharacterized protein (TIGR02594 family)
VIPPWLTAARSSEGVVETLGPNDSKWIRRMWASLSGSWLLGQPWCGGAMAYWMQQALVSYPRAYYRAKAWLAWGVPISYPAVGAVVVFERSGGGHVGLIVGLDKIGRLMVLGANQGDAVRVSAFSTDRVLGYRWPAEQLALLSDAPLPILAASGPLSTNEA